MFILGQAHLSHPAKHVLGSAVGGGWPLSQAQHWVANKSSAEPGSPSAGRQTTEGGRPWPGLTRPGLVRLARPAAATLTNRPLLFGVAPCRSNTPPAHPASRLDSLPAGSFLAPPFCCVHVAVQFTQDKQTTPPLQPSNAFHLSLAYIPGPTSPTQCS
jgi:hypothetical protein